MSTHELKVDESAHGQRLDVFITHHLPEAPSRSFVKKLIDSGNVKVNETILKPHHKVAAGEDILITIPGNFLEDNFVAPEDIPLDIFYEDEQILIINKPAGMIVHPARGCYSGTLVNALLFKKINLSDFNTDTRPGIVHRLDQETSGLMVIAKDNITHTKLAKQFQRREVKKQYVAVVEGEIAFDEGLIDAAIGRHPFHRDKKTVAFDDAAKPSQTFYKVIQRKNGRTLVKLFPKTGRTHQIRVHLAYQRHPILGDEKYGKRKNFPRMALHAQALGFRHPATKAFVEFTTPVPEIFLKTVE